MSDAKTCAEKDKTVKKYTTLNKLIPTVECLIRRDTFSFTSRLKVSTSKLINTFENRWLICYMCSILTKGSTCRKNKIMRFLLILIEQVMTNLLEKN